MGLTLERKHLKIGRRHHPASLSPTTAPDRLPSENIGGDSCVCLKVVSSCAGVG